MTEIGLPFKEKGWTGAADLLSQRVRDERKLEILVESIGSTLNGNRTQARGLAGTFTECYRHYPDSRGFIRECLPSLQRAVLEYADAQPHFTSLDAGTDASVTLSRRAVHALLAGMMFCIYDYGDRPEDYPEFSMSSAYRHGNYVLLRFLIQYFTAVHDDPSLLEGSIVISRRCVDGVDWADAPELCGDVQTLSTRCEDPPSDHIVDFANKYIGGGVLSSGAVQEEIMFMIHPELIVTRLFCERMHDLDAIVVRGVRRFSTYVGYSRHLKYFGKGDLLPRNFTCIDAKPAQGIAQYIVDFDRDVNKAYAGFADLESSYVPSVATGKWGSGAFGKDSQLGFLQQYLAAAHAGVYLIYCVYDDPDLLVRAAEFVNATRGRTVRDVYRAYKASSDYNRGVFDAVLRQLDP